MKKTSILSLLGLAGFLAFSAPTFAQEVEEAADVEDTAIVAEVDDADAAVAEEAADLDAEELFKDDPEAVEKLNALGDEILDGFELTDDQRAEIEASFESPEERAAVIAGLGTLLAGAGIVYLVIACIWTIICIIALWKVFTKAGEKGWKSIIPIYNVYISFKIVGMKNWFWWMLLGAFIVCLIGAFIPEYEKITTAIASIYAGIISIVAAFKLPRKFGWGVFTSILYVLFPEICLLFLGFGGSKYQGKKD